MSRRERYELTDDFEALCTLYACSQPKFWGTIGYAVDPELLSVEAAAWAFKAAAAIAKDLGSGPSAAVLVLQRLQRWVHEGKVAAEVPGAVFDLLERAEDAAAATRVTVDAVVKELAPVVRRKAQHEVVKAALGEYAKGGDMARVAEMVQAAERIGVSDVSLGARIGARSLDDVASFRHLDRLPTGVDELDFVLSGGLPRGGLGVYVGGPGDGKSMSLTQVYTANLLSGLFCLYATLELPEPVVMARSVASLTDTPTDDILSGEDAGARRVLAELMPRLGVGIIKEFAAKATTVADVLAWVKECEDQEGRQADLLVVDYADKLGAGTAKAKGEYDAAGIVYEGLRLHAVERRMWVWTASQATRGTAGKKRKRIDLDDTADSMHKVRVADLVVSINVREGVGDELETLYYIAKNRHGRGRVEVGPLPTEFAYGRQCALAVYPQRPADA